MENEISYTLGQNFKITITTDNQLRLKIPEDFKETTVSIAWIEMCHKILKQLKSKELCSEFTLRGKSRLNSFGYFHSLVLQSEHSHSGKRKINEIKCSIYENDVNVEKYIPKETE
jgi:hypothetical protein